jgi:CheY-like chemotaxis protein
MKKTEKKILLVEDDYLDVESVKRALKKLGIRYEIEVAHNGVDALALLTSERCGEGPFIPDALLLDLNMPKMNGIEFLRIIRNYFSLKTIKTFVITTSGEEYDKIAAGNLGVEGYILKPLDFSNTNSSGIQKLREILLN